MDEVINEYIHALEYSDYSCTSPQFYNPFRCTHAFQGREANALYSLID